MLKEHCYYHTGVGATTIHSKKQTPVAIQTETQQETGTISIANSNENNTLHAQEAGSHIANNTVKTMNNQQSPVANLTNTTREAPKYIFLLGERNSGTNYIEKLLLQSFYPKYSFAAKNTTHNAKHKFGGCSPDAAKMQYHACAPVLKYKHMFRHSLLSESEMDELRRRTDVLWILAVRSPCDWADSMYRKPWHMCLPSDPPSKCKGEYVAQNKDALANVSKATFFGDMPWWENPEARHESVTDDDFVYPNGIFELRAHKLRIMKQLIEAVGPHRVKLAPLHYIELSPGTWIRNVAKEYGLELNAEANDLKPSKKIKSHETKCLTNEEWHVAQSKIDWDLEGRFGYTQLDCHTCV